MSHTGDDVSSPSKNMNNISGSKNSPFLDTESGETFKHVNTSKESTFGPREFLFEDIEWNLSKNGILNKEHKDASSAKHESPISVKKTSQFQFNRKRSSKTNSNNISAQALQNETVKSNNINRNRPSENSVRDSSEENANHTYEKNDIPTLMTVSPSPANSSQNSQSSIICKDVCSFDEILKCTNPSNSEAPEPISPNESKQESPIKPKDSQEKLPFLNDFIRNDRNPMMGWKPVSTRADELKDKDRFICYDKFYNNPLQWEVVQWSFNETQHLLHICDPDKYTEQVDILIYLQQIEIEIIKIIRESTKIFSQQK